MGKEFIRKYLGIVEHLKEYFERTDNSLDKVEIEQLSGYNNAIVFVLLSCIRKHLEKYNPDAFCSLAVTVFHILLAKIQQITYNIYNKRSYFFAVYRQSECVFLLEELQEDFTI